MAANEHHIDVVVVGGGQAGLTVGYHLQQKGIDFVILDGSERVGDAWRHRWDSLRLFTQARMNGLPGMPYPGPGGEFIGKDDVADYLEQYAEKMQLPVHNSTRVTRLSRDDYGYVVETADATYRARQVVVAMAGYQKPKVPPFAPDLDPDIYQIHTVQYRNPQQLKPGSVLVVGMGNSGADIAFDVAATHDVTIAGNPTAAIPFKLESWFGRTIGTRLVRFVMVKVLNTSTPMGRKARPKMLNKAAPLVRVRPQELAKAGVKRVGHITDVVDGYPVAEDGTTLRVDNVIWCTGYRPGFEWIDLPVLDDAGKPIQTRGIVADQPGLYFVGLFWLHSVWSETLPGMQIDAKYVVDHLAAHRPAAVGV